MSLATPRIALFVLSITHFYLISSGSEGMGRLVLKIKLLWYKKMAISSWWSMSNTTKSSPKSFQLQVCMHFVKEISISLCSNTIAYSFHNASQGVLKKKRSYWAASIPWREERGLQRPSLISYSHSIIPAVSTVSISPSVLLISLVTMKELYWIPSNGNSLHGLDN